jgi:transposase
MMRPLSIDLRLRIVAAVQTGEHSIAELAELFAVNLSTIVRLLQRFRKTGSVQPKPHGGGTVPKLDARATARLLQLVREKPDATLAELRTQLGVACSIVTIFRALKKNQITRKKKTYHAEERDIPRVQEQRQAFMEKLQAVDPKQLVFVDETGATTAMGRTYGRALAGERVQASAPGAWEKVTLISGLRTSGVVAPLALPGATDRPAFEAYVEQVLVPELGAGDVVVWDNLSAHKSKAAVAAIEVVGARVEPLPVYSPDLTPIEEMFSKIKAGLRTIAARSVDAVITGMGKVLDQVSPTDALGWFHDRCPYAMQT